LTADIRVRLRGGTVTVGDGEGVKLTHAADRAAGAVGLGTDGTARFAALSVRRAGD
jgi:hypothetical protein